jgi:glycosyltransferase involved in cell wall biosynthesis
VSVASPFLTVVICTYNRAERLPAAVRSVLEQTFTDFELVVVDDGSTDDTRSVVVAMADPRIRYLYRTNGGLSAARNSGVDAARGEAVVFLDDDDAALPFWLERLAAALRDPRCAFVSCGAIFSLDGREHQTLPSSLGPVFDDHHGLIRAGTFGVRRSAYIEAGGFAEDILCNHQTEFAMRVLPLCTARGWAVAVVDEALVRLVFTNVPRERDRPERLLSCTEAILERHGARLRRDPKAYADYCSICGVNAARLGRFRDATRWFARATRSQPRNLRHGARLALTPARAAAGLIRRSGKRVLN